MLFYYTMLLCPLQNYAFKTGEIWTQQRPYVTQNFGENPKIYAQFGLKAHNGTDFRCAVGTPIFAPCDGELIFLDDGDGGYGKHCKIRSIHGRREIVLGHFSKFVGKNRSVNMGDLIAYSGNTGFSTGAHLHFGMRNLIESEKDIWQWSVDNYNNGYKGYIDIEEYVLCWKGTIKKNTL